MTRACRCASKGTTPRDRCAHTHRCLDIWKRVSAHPTAHTQTHTPTPGRPTLGPPGTQGRAHASRSHAHLPPRGRADSHTRGLADTHNRTRKNVPHPALVSANHPLPSRAPAVCPGRAHSRAHRPLPRTPGAPRSPWVPLRCPRGLSPQSRRRAHLLRGVPGLLPAPAPRRAPACRLRTPRRARLHNLEQVPPFPHFGRGRTTRVVGSGRRRGLGGPCGS